jgi:amino acid transporter
MSSDGLLFGFLSKINEKTKTPFIAAIICGVCAGTYMIDRPTRAVRLFC